MGQSSIGTELKLTDLSFTQWTSGQGLSSSNNTSVISDHQGVLWITSFNGLMRYDAERIRIFDKSNTDILDTDGFLVSALAPDSSIYFGTQGSGLLRYRKGNLESVTSDQISIPRSIRALHIDENGTLYFGGQNKGLFVINGDTAFHYPGESIKDVSLLKIIKTDESVIWIGTEGNGIFKIDGDSITNYNLDQGLLSNYVSDIHAYRTGGVIFATQQGIHRISPSGQVSVINKLKHVYTNVFYMDEWNTLWVGGEAALYRYHFDTDRLEEMKRYRSIDFVRISSIIKDHQGSIWITSSRSGLIQVKESLVNNLIMPTLSSNRINIVHEAKDGRILIGTDKNKIDIWERGMYSTVSLKTDLKGNGIRNILDEPDGTLWLATYVGMVRVKNGKEQLYNTATGMPANTFRVVIKDKFGNYWFGTRSGGLIKFRDDQIIEVFDLSNKLESDFVLALEESKDGSIYVGTYSGGLSIIRPDGQIETYHVKDDDSGILIFNVDIRPGGKAILTTNLGPAFFDGEKIISVPLESNGNSSTFFDAIWDQKDHLWITTNIGILKIKKSDWNGFLMGRISKVPYAVINEMSGMNNRECTGATKSTLSKNGTMYFPTLGGVCIINPNNTIRTSHEPSMIMSQVTIDNQAINDFDREIILEPGQTRVDFEYSLVSFQTIGQNKYLYQLEGFDDSLNQVTSIAKVSYTNLPPGNFDFKVFGSSGEDNWYTTPAQVHLVVKPHYYETWWFYLMATLFIIGTFWIIYYWRLNFINQQNLKLKKVNAELDRFVYSASHELRSPLTSVLGIVSLAKHEKGDISEFLNHIETSVKRLDGFIKDIIDYSRNTRLDITSELIDLNAMIDEILEGISYTDNFKKIDIQLENNLKRDFFSDAKRLSVAMTNLINNAIKHHDPEQIENPFVRISIQDEQDNLLIKVEDNGPGIEDEYKDDIFKMFFRATVRTEGTGIGLYIVKEILEKLNGEVSLASEVGKGTTFTITLPFDEAG